MNTKVMLNKIGINITSLSRINHYVIHDHLNEYQSFFIILLYRYEKKNNRKSTHMA